MELKALISVIDISRKSKKINECEHFYICIHTFFFLFFFRRKGHNYFKKKLKLNDELIIIVY